MTTANPFFELGYPMDSVAHPLLPWWRQRVLAQKQGSRVVEATFTFERWDGMSVGQKTWTWTHDETPEALLARRRDVLASLLELDQANPLPVPPIRAGLVGVRFGIKDDVPYIMDDWQITAVERQTDPIGYQFYPPHGNIDGVPTWGHEWPLPGFVIVDPDSPWCPPEMGPAYPWIDAEMLMSDKEAAPAAPAAPDDDADLGADDDTAENPNLVHVQDEDAPLCGSPVGMMIPLDGDEQARSAALAQVDCDDCHDILTTLTAPAPPAPVAPPSK